LIREIYILLREVLELGVPPDPGKLELPGLAVTVFGKVDLAATLLNFVASSRCSAEANLWPAALLIKAIHSRQLQYDRRRLGETVAG
jgi:hypothetical protein